MLIGLIVGFSQTTIAAKTTAYQPPNHQQDLMPSKAPPEVTPEDEMYQVLTSLLDRYNCPDSSFSRKAQPVTRMEFAIVLNAYSKYLHSLTPAPPSRDLATLQNLEQKFSAELKILHERADSLEARTTILEPQQFSTTTTMTPAAIFEFNFAEVKPVDWEFKALRSLAERYQCNIRDSYNKNQNAAQIIQFNQF